MNRLKSLVALAFVACVVASCSPEFNEITPTYALPVVSSKLGVYNLLAKVDSNFIHKDNQGQISLVYGNDIFELPGKSIVVFADQNLTTDATYSGPTINPFNVGQEATVTNTVDLNFFGVSAQELYRLLVDTGNLAFNMTSTIKHSIDYTITFNEVETGSGPLTITGTSEYTGSNHSVTRNVDLHGADMDFSINNTTFSKLRVTYNMKIRGKGGNGLSNGEKMSLSFGLNDIVFDQVECYLGQQTIALPTDSISINLFQFTDEEQTGEGGSFAFTDPGILLEFKNGCTMPLNINIKKMAVSRSDNGQQTNVVFNNFQNPFAVQYPLVPTDVATTTVTIDKSNSNLRDLIAPVNKQMIFQFDASINPGGKTINKFDKDSKLAVKASINLPMAGYGFNWVLADTTALGLSLDAQKTLKSGLVRLNIDNNFPIDVDLQVYFLDASNNLLDSLFDDGIKFLKSPPLDSQGKVVGSILTTKDIPADNVKMGHITGSAKVAVVARLQTPDAMNQREVRIYESNYIAVKMGIKAELSITGK